MNNRNSKNVIITSAVLTTLIIANILFFGNWITMEKTDAAITNGIPSIANNTTTGVQLNSKAAMDASGNFIITFESPDASSSGVYFRRFNSNNTAKDATDIQVNTNTTGFQGNPAIASDRNGNFIIAWLHSNGSSYDVYARAYQANGTSIGSSVKINTVSSLNVYMMPSIALDYDNGETETKAAIVWQESLDGTTSTIKMQPIQVDFSQSITPLSTLGGEITVNSTPGILAGATTMPVIAMSTSKTTVVIWRNSSENSVYYQAYKNISTPIGTNTKANSSLISNITYQPTIAADKKTYSSTGGVFYIGFKAKNILDEYGIYIRKVTCQNDETCSLSQNEIEAGQETVGTFILHPSIASDALGNFTVSWEKQPISGAKQIIARNYQYNEGKPIGQTAPIGPSYILRSITLPDNDSNPSIIMNDDGSYVIVWDYYNSSTSAYDVYFQNYVSDLFKKGKETLLTPPDTNTQTEIDIAISQNGDKAAVWRQTSPNGIYYSLWDSNNNIVAENIRINTDGTINDAANPTIEFYKDNSEDHGDNINRLIIAWESSVPTCAESTYSTSAKDIWYREILPNGNPVGTCEKKVNQLLANDGNQLRPQITTQHYWNGSSVTDQFTVVYLDQPTVGSKKITTVSHSGLTPEPAEPMTDFVMQTVASCNNCTNSYPEVISGISTSNVIYTWTDENSSTLNDVVMVRKAVGTTLGATATVFDDTVLSGKRSSVSLLPGNQFAVSFVTSDDAGTAGDVRMARFNFGDPTPVIVDTPVVVNTLTSTGNTFSSAKIVTDEYSGHGILVWSQIPNIIENDQIYGQLFEYTGSSAGNFKKFGPNFHINSTQSGSQILPSAAINSLGNIIIGWEGFYQQDVGISSVVDNAGTIAQSLQSPLFIENYPSLYPTVLQEVISSGRTISLPANISFPNTPANFTGSTTVQTSIRDATYGGDTLKYIEVTDLDGAPFTLSATLADDFVLSGTTTKYLPRSNVFIRNWDHNPADTRYGDGSGAQCSETEATICSYTVFTTVSGATGSFLLNPSSSDFGTNSLNNDVVLVNKSSDHEIGQWKIYPEFKITIPARTPPGSHKATLIFSLT